MQVAIRNAVLAEALRMVAAEHGWILATPAGSIAEFPDFRAVAEALAAAYAKAMKERA